MRSTDLVIEGTKTVSFDVGSYSQWSLEIYNKGQTSLTSLLLQGQIASGSDHRTSGKKWTIASNSPDWERFLVNGYNPYQLASKQFSFLVINCTYYRHLILSLTGTAQIRLIDSVI